MTQQVLLSAILLFATLPAALVHAAEPSDQLSKLKKDQKIADFRVTNVYSDAAGKIMGAKFLHTPSGSPVFVLQIETVPQVFIAIDEPSDSDKGLPHSLEHLVYGKGIKGRYARLLTEMKLGGTQAFTSSDFNAYHFYSGGAASDLLEQLHAWLDALFRPDFSDIEAEREFYNFGVTADLKTGKKTLIEKGTVYNEMNARPGISTYYYQLRKQVYGENSPFGFDSGGVPEAMRGVTPKDIRQFHAKFYSLGPQTAFIFAISPKNDVPDFLQNASRVLRDFTVAGAPPVQSHATGPKYPIASSSSTEIKVYPFPSKSPVEPGQIYFGWKPEKTDSMVELRLLELLVQNLGRGEDSILYKALADRKTRGIDSGATSVFARTNEENSPHFPAMELFVSGVPGNRITPELIERLRGQVKKSIQEISQYKAHSEQLLAFNRLVGSHQQASHRFENVWIRNAPQFGIRSTGSFWKEYLDYLEMDPAFNRSLSEETVVKAINEKLRSGENIWAGLIEKFHLLETPYVTASAPSPDLLEQNEKKRQERVAARVKELMQHYNTSDEQRALSLFEQDEQAKSKEVEDIEARVSRPRFTEHPPMTPDDGVQYAQTALLNVPVIQTAFDNPPTMDVGFSFDLRSIPRKYYKYLPLLPRFIDDVGLKEGTQTLSYSDVLEQIQRDIYQFSMDYESNALSHRADFTIRASAASADEFRTALRWMGRLLNSNDLNPANVDRLRDIVEQSLSADDFFTKRGEENWINDPVNAFRYQDDELFLALNSHFTRAHWHSRMKWLLHKPVSTDEIDKLAGFANETLISLDKLSRREVAQKLESLKSAGLEGELVEYWRKNLPSFAEAEIAGGLRQLTAEVAQDLRIGPEQTIQELKDLQRLIINRAALHLDLTSSRAALEQIKPDLLKFLESIPAQKRSEVAANGDAPPILTKLQRRYSLSAENFPFYVALVNLDGVSGNTVFTARFPGYDDLDRQSLLDSLSSHLRSGGGPESLYMKTWEAGLAYSNGIRSTPASKLIRYYADRSPNIPALVELVNSLSVNLTALSNQSMLDYVLTQAFSYSRAMFSFTQRGRAMAADLRDGRDPEQVRHYAEALLKLREDPNLVTELIQAAPDATGRVLLKPEFQEKQRVEQAIFFMIGPENILSQAEQQLSIPKLMRLWPSDYWVQ